MSFEFPDTYPMECWTDSAGLIGGYSKTCPVKTQMEKLSGVARFNK